MKWALVLLFVAPAFAQGKEKVREFPLRASITVPSGGKYYILGRKRIPKGMRITVQNGVTIEGRGDEAVLEVEGELQLHGVTGKMVVIENLWIEPAPRFLHVRLDMVDFRHSGGLRNPGETPIAGALNLENTDFGVGVMTDLTFNGGGFRILNCSFREPVRMKGVPGAGGKITFGTSIISNYFHAPLNSPKIGWSGFMKGLFITGANKAIVRNSRIAGERCEFIDCGKLTFDGNKVDARRVLFRETSEGGFKGRKVQKTDFYSKEITFESPKGKSKESVVIDKCWFYGGSDEGITDKKEILGSILKAGHNNEESGVFIRFRKINKRPLQLAGKYKKGN